MMRSVESLGGLNKLAEDLEVERIGTEHTAGSDLPLTQASFFKMQKLFFRMRLTTKIPQCHPRAQELWARHGAPR